jgi:hypothetical protein
LLLSPAIFATIADTLMPPMMLMLIDISLRYAD